MNQKDTEIIGRVIKAELGALRDELKTAIDEVARIKLLPGPRGERGEPGIPGETGVKGLDGKDGRDGENGEDGRDGLNGKDGRDGEKGKDGRDGREGKDGRDGKDAFELAILDGFDVEKDYAYGTLAAKDGGLWRYVGDGWRVILDGVKSVDSVFDGNHEITLSTTMASGRTSETKFIVPGLVYREIFDPTQDYEPGDFVTYQGSMWACMKPTKETPGTKDSGWRLAVKRGLNGRSK